MAPFFYLLFSLFLLIPLSGTTQNLVPNGGFEDYDFCPSLTNGYTVEDCSPDWFSPSVGTPDYFNSCSQQLNMYGQLSMSAPINRHGYQQPHSGDAYAGFITTLFNDGVSYHEYSSIKLSEPLEAQRYYRIEYYVSLADSIWWDSDVDYLQYFDALGAAVSVNSPNDLYIGVPSPIRYSWPVQMRSTPGVFFSDSMGWQKVEGLILADGGEEYLTIGCFNSWSETQSNYFHNQLSFIETYYFVDDVSLTPLDSFAASVELPNIFSPNGDKKNDLFSFQTGSQKGSITITNRWGNSVFRSDLPFSWDGTSEGQQCTEGVYYYLLQSESGTQSGFVHLVR